MEGLYFNQGFPIHSGVGGTSTPLILVSGPNSGLSVNSTEQQCEGTRTKYASRPYFKMY